jgi:secreted trypsin-like serine protease
MKFVLVLKILLFLLCFLSEAKSQKFSKPKLYKTSFNSSFYTRENEANGCGLSNIRGPAQRIVGGRFASDGEFPWIISLHKNERFRCGGSIIDTKTIVTAAHCVQGFVKFN